MNTDKIDQRVAIIRTLTRNEGLTFEKLLEISPDELALFHVSTPAELHHTILAILPISESGNMLAIRYALNIETPKVGSLERRRLVYCALVGTSPRTAIRHEIKGIGELLAQIDFCARYKSDFEEPTFGDDDTATILELRAEILRLRIVAARAKAETHQIRSIMAKASTLLAEA